MSLAGSVWEAVLGLTVPSDEVTLELREESSCSWSSSDGGRVG